MLIFRGTPHGLREWEIATIYVLEGIGRWRPSDIRTAHFPIYGVDEVLEIESGGGECELRATMIFTDYF